MLGHSKHALNFNLYFPDSTFIWLFQLFCSKTFGCICSILLGLFIESQAFSLPFERIISLRVKFILSQGFVNLFCEPMDIPIFSSLFSYNHLFFECLRFSWVHLTCMTAQSLSFFKTFWTVFALEFFSIYWPGEMFWPVVYLIPKLQIKIIERKVTYIS